MFRRTVAVTMAVLTVAMCIAYFGRNQLKAQQNGPAYSATSLGETGVMVIFTLTGKIDFCSSWETLNGYSPNFTSIAPSGTCVTVGTLPAGSGNWAVMPGPAMAAPGGIGNTTNVWLTNVGGQIMNCALFSGPNGPLGSCVNKTSSL